RRFAELRQFPRPTGRVPFLGLGHPQQDVFTLLVLLAFGKFAVNPRGLDFGLPILLQRLDRFRIAHISFAVSRHATSAGTSFDLACCTVMTNATEPMINPAAKTVRALSVSPAKSAPRITATIGFTYA